MQHEPLGQALADMKAVDAHKAELAETVVESMTGGQSIEIIDLAGVQRFAWYTLPLKWMVSPDHRHEALEAGADLLDRLGLAGYAELLRSPLTAGIHGDYARSDDAGIKTAEAAYRASGIAPPDVDAFVWGEVTGGEEAASRNAAERELEQAMDSGQMTPGARGWKKTAVEVTTAVLDGPHPEIPGQTRRTAILTERLEFWLRNAQHSPDLHSMRSDQANRLLHPIAVPADLAKGMEPVVWFLEWIGQGAELTQAGYLPTAMVREGWERFRWDRGWTDQPPQKEIDLTQIYVLHLLLRRMGALQKRHRKLLVTKLGHSMLEDLERTWRMVAAQLSESAWHRAVAEVYTLLMLDGESLDRTLETRATRILGESGWQSDGEPPDSRTVLRSWYDTRHPLEVFGGVAGSGDWTSRTTDLTQFGEAMLLEQIRADATGPGISYLRH